MAGLCRDHPPLLRIPTGASCLEAVSHLCPSTGNAGMRCNQEEKHVVIRCKAKQIYIDISVLWWAVLYLA